MLGVGWTEMLIIGVVALIVIGPKELPALMHKIGKFAGTIRRMGQDFQRELNKTTGLDEVKNLRASIAAPLKATTDAIRKEFNTTTPTGQVQPSGALKPADPKAESVVDEIHAAAGMKLTANPVYKDGTKPTVQTPAEAMKEAVAKATKDTTLPGPAKAAAKPKTVKAPPRVKAAAAPVEAPAKPKVAVKKAPPKKVESPAPVEAIAPAKPRARKKPETVDAAPAAAPAKRRAAPKKATT
jgi:sec-independent protein translocase protein TatB